MSFRVVLGILGLLLLIIIGITSASYSNLSTISFGYGSDGTPVMCTIETCFYRTADNKARYAYETKNKKDLLGYLPSSDPLANFVINNNFVAFTLREKPNTTLYLADINTRNVVEVRRNFVGEPYSISPQGTLFYKSSGLYLGVYELHELAFGYPNAFTTMRAKFRLGLANFLD